MKTTHRLVSLRSQIFPPGRSGLLVTLFALFCLGSAELAAQGSQTACLAKKSFMDRLEFATQERANKILRRPNDWSHQLSAFERSARVRTLDPVSKQEFLNHAGDQGLDWPADEQAHWGSLAEVLSEAAEGLNFRMPQAFMVRTTGLEEFNAAYSRNQAIVLPQERADLDEVAGDVRRDFFLLAHELYHLLSWENPAMRTELYALLGFERFAGIDYPPELADRLLSNPGSHHYEHALEVQTASGPKDVVPFVQSTVPLEEVIELPTSGPPAIFGVLNIVLVPVDLGTGDVLRDGNGILETFGFANTDWVPQMLRNSNFIISPEELMADNFALLMEWRATGVQPTATPGGFPVNDVELLLDIEDVLTEGCNG